MSKNNLQDQQNTEEIDLGQLLKIIGKGFNNLFSFIGGIFKTIFSTIIYGLKAIIHYYKVVFPVVILAALVGLWVGKSKNELYYSQMLIKPHFDSKYQLVANVSYYNSLIANGEYTTLSKVFKLEIDDVKTLKSFKIEPGPETKNDILLEYDEFTESMIDSSIIKEVDFKDFTESRNIYSGKLFQITAESNKQDIFKKLEKGLNTSFINEYSLKTKKVKDSLIEIQRQSILASITEIDSLQNLYKRVLTEEAQNLKTKMNFGENFPLRQEKAETKDFELLLEQIELRRELQKIESKKIEENTFFDVVTSFQEYGNKSVKVTRNPLIVFPIVAFLFLSLIYFISKSIKFIKQYEG